LIRHTRMCYGMIDKIKTGDSNFSEEIVIPLRTCVIH
jgi:hypothetical protein